MKLRELLKGIDYEIVQGQIDVESKENVGTKFTVTIPIKHSPDQMPSRASAQDVMKKYIGELKLTHGHEEKKAN